MRDRFFILFNKEEQEYSSKGFLLLLYIFFGTILAGALLSPWFYWGLLAWSQCLGTEGSFAEFLAYVVDHDFPDFFDRIRLLSVIISLGWLMRYCGLLSWKNLGINVDRSQWIVMIRYVALGLSMLFIVSLVQGFFFSLSWREEFGVGRLLSKCLTATLAAFLVAFIEEAIFRGMVFRLFYTAMKPRWALWGSALFFAYVHFKKVPWAENSPVEWWSGFIVGAELLISPFITFKTIQFVNLFLVGIALNFLFIRKKSLLPCVGLHAGWVIYRIVYEKFVSVDVSREWLWLFGSRKVIDGLLPAIFIALLIWQWTRSDAAEEKGRTKDGL